MCVIFALHSSQKTQVPQRLNQAFWIGQSPYLRFGFLVPLTLGAFCRTESGSRIKLTASFFFTIDADATHECFKMGLIAARVTARNPVWTGGVKATEKHQVRNQRVKSPKAKTEAPNKNRVQTIRNTKVKVSKRWQNVRTGDFRVGTVFFFIDFSILQLICSKHGLVYEEKKTHCEDTNHENENG